MPVRINVVVSLFFFLAAMLVFIILQHAQVLICGQEQFFVYHPLQELWLGQFFEGGLPWISNAVGGGLPLWSDPNLAIFYPGNIVFLIFSFNTAWNISLIFHFFWGGAGIYWLCRKFSSRTIDALIAVSVFMFSTPFLAAMNSNEFLTTASWLPWIAGLTYFGLQRSARRTVIAALALSFQILGGFTYIQLLTLLLVFIVTCVLYIRSQRIEILTRFLLLISTTIVLTAIQMLPALLWLPTSSLASFWSRTELSQIPYPGILAGILVLLALRNRLMWLALLFLLLDLFLFGGSPVFAFCFAIAAAFGSRLISRKYRPAIAVVVFIAIAAELLIMNWKVPRLLREVQITTVPPAIQEIPELKQWNIHQYGVRGALGPVAGLRWGLHYASTPKENELMLWRTGVKRMHVIEQSLHSGENLPLLQDANLGYVLSDVPFRNRRLGLIKQHATKFFVYRLRVPVSPLVVSSNASGVLHWREQSPSKTSVISSNADASRLVIHRNALPGWEYKLGEKKQPVGSDSNGWMTIDLPPGNHEVQISYESPGAIAGTILTLLGTIIVLRWLMP